MHVYWKESTEMRSMTLKNKQKKKNRDFKYSPKGVCKEIAMVEWPSFKELMKQSGIVIVFVGVMAGYFVLCETGVGALLKQLF